MYVVQLLFFSRPPRATFRLNKIGKNPNIMSQREESNSMNTESKTISAVVNALAAEADQENNLRWGAVKKSRCFTWNIKLFPIDRKFSVFSHTVTIWIIIVARSLVWATWEWVYPVRRATSSGLYSVEAVHREWIRRQQKVDEEWSGWWQRLFCIKTNQWRPSSNYDINVYFVKTVISVFIWIALPLRRSVENFVEKGHCKILHFS